MSGLEDSIRSAVNMSERAAVKIEQQVGHVLGAMEQSRLNLARWTSPSGSEVDEVDGGEHGRARSSVMAFTALMEQAQGEIAQLFERRRATAGTFNIAFFGRTGSGKSTLIESFGRGSGERVSRGESDWTTEVHSVSWEGLDVCRLWDTPGINGWGRTCARSELEARARNAVEVSDIVLVCFDSQSQQASEFTKLADWTRHFGKPVIAVLNPRNPRWRLPTRSPIATQRRSISKAVAEHASNIEDNLARIGLHGVPVVAVNSKRALFARAALPYQGPDEKTLAKHRERFGIDTLERWSHFPRLAGLIERMLGESAVPVRLGGLGRQLLGALDQLDEGLSGVDQEAREANSLIDTGIERVLAVLGYPRAGDPVRRAFPVEEGVDLLTQLEARRGGPFQARERGDLQRFVTQRLAATLEPLRARSLDEAEECVIDAFDRRKDLSDTRVRQRCFDEPAMRKAANRAVDDTVAHIRKKVDLIHDDQKLDWSAAMAARIQGTAGSGTRLLGLGAQGAGLLFGASSALGMLALTNVWNPLGWAAGVAAAVGLIGGIASAVFGWFGSSRRKKAEQKRLKARRNALRSIRESVNDVYDSFVDKVLEAADGLRHEAVEQVVAPMTSEALVLHRVCAEISGIQGWTHRVRAETDEPRPGQVFVTEAARLETRLLSNPRGFWLGEDWVEDPEGLRQAERTDGPRRTRAHEPGFWDSIRENFRATFEDWGRGLEAGAGAAWLVHCRAVLHPEDDADDALTKLSGIVSDGRPRIDVVGDYNAGKSSFIRRLLLDAGQPVPDDLRIRGNPTTSEATAYPWEGCLLVDTPGLQSGRQEDEAQAYDSLADASALLYLFQPNLVVGETDHLARILRGDRDAGIASKLERTIFVVNRSDELGIDPDDDPNAYRRLVERKKVELVQALSSLGVAVQPSRVFCMASDPFQAVGDRTDATSADFDPYRSWDGFEPFFKEFRVLKRGITRIGADRSVLEGGIARLTKVVKLREAERVTEQSKVDMLTRLERDLAEAVAEGTRIHARIEADARRMVQGHAWGLLEDTLSCGSEQELAAHAKVLARWWEDRAFQSEVSRWNDQAAASINLWWEATQRMLERRIDSPGFRRAFPKISETFDGGSLTKEGSAWWRKMWNAVELPLKGATRDAVYQIGKFLNVKFKPWGATNLAKSLGRFGGALAVAGVVVDATLFARSILKERERERARKEAALFVDRSSSEVLSFLLKGDEDHPGPCGFLGELMQIIATHQATLKDEREQHEAAAQRATESMERLRECVEDAYRRLRTSQEIG